MTDSIKPLRVLSLGAGVQSTTLLYMMLRGEIEKADHIVFADTGWEPKNVYDHLERLRVHIHEAGIQFHYVTAKRIAKKVGGRTITGNLRVDAFEDVSGFVSMPLHIINTKGKRGMVKRTCTFDYKVQPILLKLREIAGLKRGERCKEIKIEQILGISYDESQRMRDPAFSWIRNDYPLIDQRVTREDCIKWCADNGYDQPPRSACVGCPFKSNEEWRNLKEMPDEWADAVDFDKKLRTSKTLLDGVPFLHSSCVPLDEVDLRTNEEKGIWSLFDGFNQECEGMCGL